MTSTYSSEQYRKRAIQMQQQADVAETEEMRQAYREIAEKWQQLAEQAEAIRAKGNDKH